jgi:hypothetical protein|tara:strand:- start:1328 stop:1978 length:651 start_codon:yes stop_codon:yes gene_type:complete
MSSGITIDAKELEEKIIKHLDKVLNEAVLKSAAQLTPIIKGIVKPALLQSSELKALSGGDLIGEFGLDRAVAAGVAAEVAERVADTVEVKSIKVSLKHNKGGLLLTIQPNNLQNVLSISNGSYSYYSRRYKTTVKIDWLDWLLTKGDAIIVAKFHFEEISGAGRSGQGKMLKGQSWRVRPEYSGTMGDNLITRALSEKNVIDNITNSMSKTLQKNL